MDCCPALSAASSRCSDRPANSVGGIRIAMIYDHRHCWGEGYWREGYRRLEETMMIQFLDCQTSACEERVAMASLSSFYLGRHHRWH